MPSVRWASTMPESQSTAESIASSKSSPNVPPSIGGQGQALTQPSDLKNSNSHTYTISVLPCSRPTYALKAQSYLNPACLRILLAVWSSISRCLFTMTIFPSF